MIKQNTPEWLDMRKSHIGASDCPIIMGVSPWKTPFALWEEKLGLRECPPQNEAMKRGHELEPIARELYSKITGNKVEPKVVFHKEHKYLMASLDGINSDGNIIVEIKCPGKASHDTAKNGKIPEVYYPQLQHQLETSKHLAKNGNNILHYFSYFNDDDWALVEVERDDSYIEDMLVKEGEFYECVKNWEAPPLSEKDFVQRDDKEWSQHAILWKDARDNMKFWEEQEKNARKALINCSKGQSSIGAGIRLTKVNRRGAVDYGAIPELSGVDLDKYRKASIESWRIG